MEIISREEARERGVKRFYTGKPCSKGHVSERFVINNYCCECGKEVAARDRTRIRNIKESLSKAHQHAVGKVISRADAAASGLTRYFTGRPCKNGHIAERMVSTLSCVECKNAHERNYYLKNPEPKHVRGRAWREKNRESVIARTVAYTKQRRLYDPLFRFKSDVRTLIAASFRNGGYTKRSKTFEILGCSWEFFISHMEKQFLKGMSWENRHLWHIDHIVPISTAKTEADVIALNHVSNLRPMWGAANLSKGKKVLFLI